MITRLARHWREPTHERGQVLIIFAAALVTLIMMLALLFDGGRALVLRRQLQTASDAAALAAVNVAGTLDPRGCSADPGPPPGAPQAAVVAAAVDSVTTNLPGYDPADVEVTCYPADNDAVRVELSQESSTFFGSIFGGGGPLGVATGSTAINGGWDGNQYSLIVLDTDNHPTWPVQRRGCPSVLLSGGPTLEMESAAYINSACLEANGGALSTNGNAATITMGGGALIRIVGEYKPQALTITPAPLEYQAPRPDPLRDVPEPTTSGLPVRASSKVIQNGGERVYLPGLYNGGIDLRSHAKAFFQPGLYYINGGGIKVNAQAQIYSVPSGVTTTTVEGWGSLCLPDTCGVLIYNTGTTTSMGPIDISAGAVVKIRSYNPDLDPNVPVEDHYRMLFWQSEDPVATSSYFQPVMNLTGGGDVFMTGTVYAPSAKVNMTGSAGGSSGTVPVDLTVQFIVWDIEFSGNASFHFRYDANAFVVPPSYGLIE